jgi:tetratricopeptide (TPR) repeat protein
VLLLIDLYPLRRLAVDAKKTSDQRLSWKRLLLEKTPFLVVALGSAFAESLARELATLQEIGVGARLTLAAPAPFIYLARTLLPVRLSPLDPLPIEPSVAWAPLLLGLAGLAAVTVGLWRRRAEWPALAVAWAAYLLLLAPAMGLTPSGQQATADRYMYVPGVVTAVLAGSVVLTVRRVNRLVVTLGILAAGTLGVATWRQAAWWHDSVSLWTRAAELDPRNDIALYNLAIALAAAGREDEAIGRYEQTLQLVPDHEFAQRNLNLIRSAQAEREGDRLAQAGNLDAAIDWYARALAVDPARLHVRAARGVALVQRGRFGEAVADLRAAFDAAERLTPDLANADNRAKEDRAVASALAFALAQIGNYSEAAAVLTRALRRHGDDHELAHNLARLLATTPDPAVRDGPLALRLALAVRDQTGGHDPRVLDTLAAAYAANGQFDRARETANQAARLARQLGHLDMAREIEAQATAYDQRRPR